MSIKCTCGRCGAELEIREDLGKAPQVFHEPGDVWICAKCRQPPPSPGGGGGGGGGGRGSGHVEQELPDDEGDGGGGESAESEDPSPEDGLDEADVDGDAGDQYGGWDDPSTGERELPKGATEEGSKEDHGSSVIYRAKSRHDFSGRAEARLDDEPLIVWDEGTQTQIIEYDSVTQLMRDSANLEFAVHPANLGSPTDEQSIRGFIHGATKRADSSYYNKFTLTRLLEATRRPPEATLVKVNSLKSMLDESMSDRLKGRVRKRKLLEGDEIEIDQYLRRDPEMWAVSRRDRKPKLCLRIGVGIGVNAGEGGEKPAWRGAALATLADLLADEGHSCEVWAVSPTARKSDGEERSVLRVLVKEAGAPLDLPAIALAVGEVAFFRLGVMVAESRRARGALRMGWGRALALDSTELDDLKGHYDIVMSQYDATSERTAVEFITKVMGSVKFWGRAGGDGSEPEPDGDSEEAA